MASEKMKTHDEEVVLALKNLRIISEEAGSSLDKILTVTVYLLEIEEYARFNEIYKKYFKENRPARTCIQADNLPFGTRVEFTTTAYV